MTDTLATNWLISWCADAEGDRPESSSYLGVQSIEIHVSDLDESRKFYLDNLGFWLLLDTGCDTENRCVVVAPPDRSAVLALVKSTESSRKVLKVGANTGITLVTDNIADKFREWSARGVRFSQMPVSVPAGIQATFEDVDGNEFNLLESPWLVDFLNSQQRAAEERREVKRRLTLEMEIAKDIQEKLFPRRLPYLMTMEYAGRCVQAHQVGGDYYDFLSAEPGHLAFVVSDVAGKGIPAALLMANLQAALRSRCALAHRDLPVLLESVNGLLHENAPDSVYATLFFASYEDKTRQLRYLNCGHPPGLLLHEDGTLVRLSSNAPVLGMFNDWKCADAELRLAPNDLLLLYTDGITETTNDHGQEYSETRLTELLRAKRHLSPQQLLENVLDTIRTFSNRELQDDITVVVARCRSIAK